MTEDGDGGGLKVIDRDMTGSENRKIWESKTMDDLEGHNKEFVLDAGVQVKKPAQEWHHVVRAVREVNDLQQWNFV